jgi:hypothetical protein
LLDTAPCRHTVTLLHLHLCFHFQAVKLRTTKRKVNGTAALAVNGVFDDFILTGSSKNPWFEVRALMLAVLIALLALAPCTHVRLTRTAQHNELQPPTS